LTRGWRRLLEKEKKKRGVWGGGGVGGGGGGGGEYRLSTLSALKYRKMKKTFW